MPKQSIAADKPLNAALGVKMEKNKIENIGFHDNRIHKIEFIDEDFNTDLVLDIDYITEWIPENDTCKFRMSPAHVIFKNVSNLSIVIKKPGFTLNSYLEVILDLKRVSVGKERYLYTIDLLADNSIEFESTGFSIVIVGKEYIKYEQHLTKNEREKKT